MVIGQEGSAIIKKDVRFDFVETVRRTREQGRWIRIGHYT